LLDSKASHIYQNIRSDEELDVHSIMEACEKA
jgi:hypothetical protein